MPRTKYNPTESSCNLSQTLEAVPPPGLEMFIPSEQEIGTQSVESNTEPSRPTNPEATETHLCQTHPAGMSVGGGRQRRRKSEPQTPRAQKKPNNSTRKVKNQAKDMKEPPSKKRKRMAMPTHTEVQEEQENTLKKKRKAKAGAGVKKEIRKYQNSSELLFAKLPFRRYIRKIVNDIRRKEGTASLEEIRIQKKAFLALQQAIEDYTVKLFQAGNYMRKHRKRKTLELVDLKGVMETS